MFPLAELVDFFDPLCFIEPWMPYFLPGALARKRDHLIERVRITQIIHRLRHHLIEVAARHSFKEVSQAGTLVAPLGTTDAFVSELGDLMSEPLGDGSQIRAVDSLPRLKGKAK